MAFSFLIAPVSAQTQTPISPEGLWLTENNRSAIKIEKCGDALCGKIAWIIRHGMTYDTKNPDPAHHGDPLCGLVILKGLKAVPGEDGEYEDGEVYKADEGTTYSASLSVLEPDKLKIRGFLGISLLGKSQVWTRTTEKNYPPCKVPGST